MKSIFKAATFLALAALFGAIGCAFVLLRGVSGEGRDVIIPRKSNLAQVSELLRQNEIIASPTAFKLLMRFTGGAHKVRAGEFRFQRNMGLLSALKVVYYGEPILHPITVPEGYSVRQIAQLLAKAQLANEQRFLSLTLNPQAAAKYHIKSPSLEGYLYPDTYKISKIDGEDRIVDMMVRRFLVVFDKSMQDRAAAMKWTMEQVVTLASIIEKETGTPDERPLISSVFHNRLAKHMRLETDPTVIYGLGEKYDGNIHKKDIHAPTPYNTYVIFGLPPGPIASPGIASLNAALSPANTKYLFFVANNHGASLFSETYGQHSKRVNEWQVDFFKKGRRVDRQLGKTDKK